MHYHKISLLLLLCNYFEIIFGVEYLDTFTNVKISYEHNAQIKNLESRVSLKGKQWTPIKYDINLTMTELNHFSLDDDIFYNKFSKIKYTGYATIYILPNIGSTYTWFKVNKLNIVSVKLSIVSEHNEMRSVLFKNTNSNHTEYYKIELKEDVQPNAIYVLHISYYANYADLVYRKSKNKIETETDRYRYEMYNPFALIIGGTFFPTIGASHVTSEFYLNITYIDDYGKDKMLWHENNKFKLTPHSVGFMFQHKHSSYVDEKFENMIKFDVEWTAELVPPVLIATVTHKILKWFEEYFDVTYPLRYIYIMASPDYDTDTYGAFGTMIVKIDAITYVLDYQTECAIYLSIARQLAYQWFGHIVSHNSVEDEWIFKSISTYLAYQAIDKLWPHLTIFDELDIELQNNIHMLSFNCRNVYSFGYKTIDILILIHYELYKKGIVIIKYSIDQSVEYKLSMKEFINKTISAEELLDHMDISKKLLPNQEFYLGIYTQIGYPVLIVNRMMSEQLVPWIEIEQKTFTYVKEHHFLRPFYNNWAIHYDFISVSVSNFQSSRNSVLFSSNTHLQQLPIDINYYLLYLQSNSYFRVNYDITNWQALQKCLMKNHENIPLQNRLILVDDVLHLARGSYLSYDLAFDLIKYMKYERAYTVWKCAINEFYYIGFLIEDYAAKENFKAFMRDLIDPLYTDMEDTLKLNSKLDKHHRYYKLSHLIQEFACYIEHDICMSKTDSLFQQWRKEFNYLLHERPHELLQNIGYELPIICFMGIKFDSKNSDHWNFMWDSAVSQIIVTPDKYIISTYIKALGKYTSNIFDIEKFINFMFFDDSAIRKYFLYEAFDAIFSNTMIGNLAFDALRRFDEINKTKMEFHIYKKVVKLAIEKIRTEEQYKFMLTLLKVKTVNELKEDYLVHSDLHRNIDWIQLHSYGIGEWLSRYSNITQSNGIQKMKRKLTNVKREVGSDVEEPYAESLLDYADYRTSADIPHYRTIDNILDDSISYIGFKLNHSTIKND